MGLVLDCLGYGSRKRWMQVWGSISLNTLSPDGDKSFWKERPLKDHQVSQAFLLWAVGQDLGLAEEVILH